MRTKIYILALTLFAFFQLHAQPKYEFRAVWVATVANIDWPSKPGLSSAEQQKEAVEILNMHEKLGMNTIILQVRPTADAFYPSEFEPWSRYLTGTQGQAPAPFYDPLKFWIEECHKRGMELHAWLNPYRVAQKFDEPLSTNHVAFEHPEWILKYGKKLYFDPGLPATRKFVNDVVEDIVERYDVDAIHFDDYFYPYPLKEAFPDTASFRQFNRGYELDSIANWRRENVDMIIKSLNETIKKTKPWVKFGISPFGVWRNQENDPKGSATKAGVTNYDDLYADIIKWQEEGWIDYTLPQLYWRIGHPLVDFELLSNWWKEHTYGRGMYIGQAPYKVNPESKIEEWTQPDQLVKQIEILRSIPKIKGSAFFSSKSFKNDLLGFQDSLSQHLYNKPAIIPPMPWLDRRAPAPVAKIRRSGTKVKWKVKEAKNEMDKAKQFVVYFYEKDKRFSFKTAENIYTITRDKEIKFKRINKKKKKYLVRVAVLDRMNNESRLSDIVTVKL